MMDGHGLGMGWGWIIGLVVLIAVIWVVVKTANQNNAPRGNQKSALDILRERYAQGEIDKHEFEERKKDL